ncbi:hypothetical protein SRHO_G00024070 [Serrasalmus rhombeus]
MNDVNWNSTDPGKRRNSNDDTEEPEESFGGQEDRTELQNRELQLHKQVQREPSKDLFEDFGQKKGPKIRSAE